MVETWNITRGRVGDPAPSAPDGGTPGAPLPRWVLVATLRRTQTRLLYARLGRAPRGVSAPRLSAGRACRPDQRPRPSLFAHSASPLAPGPLPLRGAASARRARRRFAGPVRRIPPSAPLGPRRPRPSRLPPGSPARPCAPLRGSCGTRWPRLTGASPRFAAGSLTGGRPCFVSGSPLVSAWPRRVPPRRARFAASGAAGSCPGGARGLWAALFCAPPPGLLSSRAPARAAGGGPRCCLVRSFQPLSLVVRFSPKPPPVPRPRWGPGERRADLRLVASFSAARFSRVSLARFGPFSRSPSRC